MPCNRLKVPLNLRLSPSFCMTSMTRSFPLPVRTLAPISSRISMPLLRGLTPSVVDVLANAVFVSRKLILLPSCRVLARSWSMLALLSSPTVGTSSGAVFSGFLAQAGPRCYDGTVSRKTSRFIMFTISVAKMMIGHLSRLPSHT